MTPLPVVPVSGRVPPVGVNAVVVVAGKISGLLRSEEHPVAVKVFEFIEAEKANFSIRFMCDRLGVTRQGFYAWRTRSACQRRVVDTAYLAVIKRIHTESRGNYGAPRIHAELADDYNVR